ncbi:MAG TPA: ABC transporter ATP-binding protein, partial [Chloroflexota bacterium]|nr:ABC transporter ATP-binding protein [Chloroflexota bacterium]
MSPTIRPPARPLATATTLRLLWRLARARPWFWAANVLLWIVVAILDLIPGPLMRAFFDDLSGQSPAAVGAWGVIALLVAQALVRTVVMTNAVLMDVFYKFFVSSLLRHNLLAGVLRRPGAAALQDSPGETANRFRDDAGQLGALLGTTNDFVASAVFTAAALWYLFWIDLWITLLVFVPLAAVVVITQRAFTRLAGYRQAGREATGRVTGLLGEMFDAVTAVQVAGAEARVVAQLRRLSEARRRLMLRDTVLTQTLSAVVANAVSLGTGMVLLLAAGSMRSGQFTVGDFAVFAYYLDWVSNLTRFFGRVLAQHKQASVSTARLAEVLGRGPADETLDALARPSPLGLRGPLPPGRAPVKTAADRLETLEVRGLCYHYPHSGGGIDGVDLRLARGTLTVVTGRVASGKTTLLRTLLGLLPRERGEIRWNGTPVADPASFMVPPRCAYTPQVPRLFSETLRDNILLGLPDDPQTLREAVQAAALEGDLATGEAHATGPYGRV